MAWWCGEGAGWMFQGHVFLWKCKCVGSNGDLYVVRSCSCGPAGSAVDGVCVTPRCADGAGVWVMYRFLCTPRLFLFAHV